MAILVTGGAGFIGSFVPLLELQNAHAGTDPTDIRRQTRSGT